MREYRANLGGGDLDEAVAEKLRWMIILPTTALEVIRERPTWMALITSLVRVV